MANYTSVANASKCAEEQGSPQESWGAKGLNATVTLRCLWADRYTVMADIVDNNRQYPLSSTVKSFAMSGSIQGDGQSDLATTGQHSIEYQHAILTINYKPIDYYDPGSGGDLQLFSEALEGSGEFLTLDNTGMTWDAAALLPLDNQNFGKLMLSFDYVQVQYGLASIHADHMTRVQKVNSVAVTTKLLGYIFPIETLLYHGPSMSRQITTGGTGAWTLTARFSFRPDGWNKVWRNKTKAFATVYHDGVAYDTYDPVSFANIII